MTNEEEPQQLPIAPSAIRGAVLADLERVAAFVRDLPLEVWSRPSAAANWTIGDVVTHLSLALGTYARLLGAAEAGHGAGPVWRAVSKLSEKVVPVASPAVNAVNKAVPRLLDRALAPEVVKGQFAANARALRERLTALESRHFTQPIHYLGRPWPLSFFLGMLENEIALHHWDMASRLEPSAHLSEQARAVLPWFYWSGTTLMLRPPKALTGTIAAALTNPMAEMWWKIATPTESGRGMPAEATATIRGDSGFFVLALAGRMPDAIEADMLRVEGNQEQAKQFLSSWRLL